MWILETTMCVQMAWSFRYIAKVLKNGLNNFVADYAVTSVVTCMFYSTESAISFSGNLL
jgi:hypothetical protein